MRIAVLSSIKKQIKAEQELGWNRVTISKGIKELTSGMTCEETEEGAALLE